MNMATVGIDLAKRVFHIHGNDNHGQAVLRKCEAETSCWHFSPNCHPVLIGMEACGSALLGKKIGYHGAYGKADGAAIRQALCEDNGPTCALSRSRHTTKAGRNSRFWSDHRDCLDLLHR